MLDYITLSCPCCSQDFNFELNDFVTDIDVIDEDREMGEETEYTIECEEFSCPHCSQPISINGRVWEYPVGSFNDSDLEIFSAEDEENDDDENETPSNFV